MPNDVNISGISLLKDFPKVVINNLLKDHTSQQNIYWATNSYAEKGEGYGFYDPITVEKISGDNDILIRPRAVKSKEEQTMRVKDKAEVFTPSWVCNAQNNLIDEAWFGRPNVFNSPNPEDEHKWINNTDKIVFPDIEGKSWKDYVADIRLEITCGEAPYLCNRYDAVTGEYNQTAKYRIGILDRKLRIVSENTKDSKEWITWGKIALRSTYGFEWQGDNLFLARQALFYTFKEHYIEQFGESKFRQNKMRIMPIASYIISWNIWQMDGLTFGFPGYEDILKKREELESQYRKQCNSIDAQYAKECKASEDKYQRDLAKHQDEIDKEKEKDAQGLFAGYEISIKLNVPVKQEIAKPQYPDPLPDRQAFERYCLIKDFFSVPDERKPKSKLETKEDRNEIKFRKVTVDHISLFSDLKAEKVCFKDLVNKENSNI